MMAALVLSAALAVAPASTVSAAVPVPQAASPSVVACGDTLVDTLREVGFRGRALRIAWAIVMRESRGDARAVSDTGDYGLFQINRRTYGLEAWWDDDAMLDGLHNARVAYGLAQAGKTFYPWDITGAGAHLGRYSTVGQYRAFTTWLAKYPTACRAEALTKCAACGFTRVLGSQACPTCLTFRQQR